MNYLKKEYKKEWQFFKKEMKILFPVLLVSIVLLTILSHYIFAEVYKSDANAINSVSKVIQGSMSGIDLSKDTHMVSILKLFFNNARASLIAISLGVVPFLFLPFISFFANGILVGMVTSLAFQTGGFSLSFFLASLLPHGIFEIPAIIYACALGIYLCKETTKILLKRSDKRLSNVIADTLRGYVLVILPLLIVAAIIEATITMQIAMRFV